MVNRPSWQAQLSGQKIWTLIPPPECEHVCKSMQVTMNKGEISKFKGVGRDGDRVICCMECLKCLNVNSSVLPFVRNRIVNFNTYCSLYCNFLFVILSTVDKEILILFG